MGALSSENLFIANLYIYIYMYGIAVLLARLFFSKSFHAISILLSAAIIIYFSMEFSVRELEIGTDTLTYYYFFSEINSAEFSFSSDLAFYGLMYIVNRFASFESFLFLTTFIYMGAACWAFIRIFKERHYIAFFIFIMCPYFFLFGINGIRNGTAASILLLAFSFYENKKVFYLLLLTSCLTHLSMIIPAASFLFIKKKGELNWLLLIWISVLSMFIANVDFNAFITLLTNYSNSSKAEYNLTGNGLTDFLIYGLPIVLINIYVFYSYATTEKEKRYFCLYLIGSCLQIMAIKSPLFVRYAYFAGFMLPVMLTIPLRIFKSKRIEPLFMLALLFVFSIKAYKLISLLD